MTMTTIVATVYNVTIGDIIIIIDIISIVSIAAVLDTIINITITTILAVMVLRIHKTSFFSRKRGNIITTIRISQRFIKIVDSLD